MTSLPPQFVRNCSAFAACTLVVWDSLIDYDREYQHIWGSPSGAVKRMYLFSRYYGIGAHLANCIIVAGPLSSIRNSQLACALWYNYQVFSFFLLMFALEMVLSLRVYALYGKNRSIGVLLICMIIAGVFISTFSGVRTIRGIQFEPSCAAKNIPYEVACFSMFAFARHGFVWMMTIRRRNIGRLGDSGRAPVVRLMLRDGAWIFAIFSAMLTTVTPYCVMIPAVTQTLMPWTISLVSLFTCRLILNMQQLRTSDATTPEFTTNVDFGGDTPSDSARYILDSIAGSPRDL